MIVRAAQRPLRRDVRACRQRSARSWRFTGTAVETFEAAVADAPARARRVVKAERHRDRAPAEERVRRRAARVRGGQASGWPRAARCAPARRCARRPDEARARAAQRDRDRCTTRCPASCSRCAARRSKPAPRATSSTCSTSSRSAPSRASSPGAGRVTIRRPATAAPRQPHPPPNRRQPVSECHVEQTASAASPCRRPRRAALLGGCSALDRLKNIGEQPPLSAIENPTTQPGYKPVQMPMPAPQPAVYNPNSLWRNGSRAFFKDQRAIRSATS